MRNQKHLVLAVSLVLFGAIAISYLLPRSSVDKQVIKVGYGTEDCYVGMEERMLTGDWSPPRSEIRSLPDLVYQRSNYSKGLQVRFYKGKVLNAIIYLRATSNLQETIGSPDYSAFPGVTTEGADLGSTMADIVALYGEPSDRIEISAEGRGVKHVTLLYESLGCNFSFDGEQLSSVVVYDPDFDIETIHAEVRDAKRTGMQEPKNDERVE